MKLWIALLALLISLTSAGYFTRPRKVQLPAATLSVISETAQIDR